MVYRDRPQVEGKRLRLSNQRWCLYRRAAPTRACGIRIDVPCEPTVQLVEALIIPQARAYPRSRYKTCADEIEDCYRMKRPDHCFTPS
jgi:hypothetical protein